MSKNTKNVKRGNEVVVISGADKGKKGKILEVIPATNRVIVEGVALRKKHTKPSQDNPEGGIVEREGSIHRSNVMLASLHEQKLQRKA